MAALAGASGGGAAGAVHKVFMFRLLREEGGGGSRGAAGSVLEGEACDVPGLQVGPPKASHHRKKSSLMDKASGAHKRVSSRLGSMFRAMGGSASNLLPDSASPVDEFALVAMGLEFVVVKPEFHKDDVFVVVAESEVESGAGERHSQRELHVLASDPEGLLRAGDAVAQLSARMGTDGMRQAVHGELMGRESAQFEVHLKDFTSWLVYLDGKGPTGFGRLAGEEALLAPAPRLLQLSQPTAYASLSRAWQVPCSAASLDAHNAFALDAGKDQGRVYFYQKKHSPAAQMAAAILAPLLGAPGNTTLDPDASMWKLLGCGSAQEAERRMRADKVLLAGCKVEHPEAQIWVAEGSPGAPKFRLISSKKINLVHLSKAGTDKPYVVVGGRELFVYTHKKGQLSFVEAVKVSLAFAAERGFSADTSVSLVENEVDAVNLAFDALFPY
jgi:hypothetical protein